MTATLLGTPFVSPFTATVFDQFNQLATLANGNLVSVTDNGIGGEVGIQFYNPFGEQIGAQINVPQGTIAHPANPNSQVAAPEVVALTGGGFAVRDVVAGANQWPAVRTFDANGNPTSGWDEIDGPTANGGVPSFSEITATATGGFAVDWDTADNAHTIFTIRNAPVAESLDAEEQAFSATGAPGAPGLLNGNFGLAFPQAVGFPGELTNGSVVTPYIDEANNGDNTGDNLYVGLNGTPILVYKQPTGTSHFVETSPPAERCRPYGWRLRRRLRVQPAACLVVAVSRRGELLQR